MPTYISLVSWTEDGIKEVKQTLQRADQNAELAQKYGCTLSELYWTIGPYDLVSIVEAPDEESAAAYSLDVGSQGTTRTTTLRAFNREEATRIIAKLG